MQIHLLPLPPVQVSFVTPASPWYAQWDFWVSVGTLVVALMTGCYAWETRRPRKGSDRSMAALSRHAEAAAKVSQDSAAAAQRSAEALKVFHSGIRRGRKHVFFFERYSGTVDYDPKHPASSRVLDDGPSG
jgi:hypothetical protein